MFLHDRVDHRADGLCVADVTAVELVGQSSTARRAQVTTTVPPGEHLADARADARTRR